MKRFHLLTVLAAFVIVFVWLLSTFFSGPRGETETAHPPSPELADHPEPVPSLLPSPDPMPDDAAATDPLQGRKVVAVGDDATVVDDASDPVEENIRVVGTIVVVDADDVEHRTERGAFTPVFWTGSFREHGELCMVNDTRRGLSIRRALLAGALVNVSAPVSFARRILLQLHHFIQSLWREENIPESPALETSSHQRGRVIDGVAQRMVATRTVDEHASHDVPTGKR